MKKLLFLFGFVFVFCAINAQENIRFGITGGVDYTTMTKIVDGGWKFGYKVGVISDIPIKNRFYFQPSLLFSSKGYKDKEWADIRDWNGEPIENVSFSQNANFIELPLMFAYKFPSSGYIGKVMIYAGPYIAYGIAGKSKFSNSLLDELSFNTFEGSELLGTEDENALKLKRFDCGFSVGIAEDFGRIKVSLQYDQGIIKAWGDAKTYHYGVFLGLGVFL